MIIIKQQQYGSKDDNFSDDSYLNNDDGDYDKWCCLSDVNEVNPTSAIGGGDTKLVLLDPLLIRRPPYCFSTKYSTLPTLLEISVSNMAMSSAKKNFFQ